MSEISDRLEVSTAAQFKALGHPLRHRLLFALGKEAATISQLAVALGTAKGNVAHHLGVLRDAGMVHVAETRQVRGGTEQYYRRSARSGSTSSVKARGRTTPSSSKRSRPSSRTTTPTRCYRCGTSGSPRTKPPNWPRRSNGWSMTSPTPAPASPATASSSRSTARVSPSHRRVLSTAPDSVGRRRYSLSQTTRTVKAPDLSPFGRGRARPRPDHEWPVAGPGVPLT